MDGMKGEDKKAYEGACELIAHRLVDLYTIIERSHQMSARIKEIARDALTNVKYELFRKDSEEQAGRERIARVKTPYHADIYIIHRMDTWLRSHTAVDEADILRINQDMNYECEIRT
jgi:hypothetical protein